MTGVYFESASLEMLSGEGKPVLKKKNFLKPYAHLPKGHVVTNMDWDGESIIHWHRKRCGYSEHVHSEMKEEFCGGQLPSGRFGANAAWWWIMLISLNLNSIMKSIVLGKVWKKRRMKSIRFSIINIAGRVIKKGKELVIRLSKGHPCLDLLMTARKRIASLCSCCVPGG